MCSYGKSMSFGENHLQFAGEICKKKHISHIHRSYFCRYLHTSNYVDLNRLSWLVV